MSAAAGAVAGTATPPAAVTAGPAADPTAAPSGTPGRSLPGSAAPPRLIGCGDDRGVGPDRQRQFGPGRRLRLLCRGLVDRGFGTKDAVDYWLHWSAPPEPDADLDGLPSETVFPDVPLNMPQYY